MIVKFVNKLILIIAALLCLSLNSYAQYSSKEELKEAANKMFEEKDYGGSLKLFSQLLSTYPKDPNYNYKYGACVLFGSRDKEEALHYLKFAVTNSNVDPVAFYFLGKGYHHEYEFSKALKNYKLFKEKATSKDQKKYSVDREIEMCQNGGSLLKSIVDIGVLSKKEIKESDFFRSYKLNGIGGTIIVKPEQFKTKLDKKNNEKSIVYLGQAKDMVLFSSYGKNGANGKDIYKSVKNSNGDWGEATLFSANINSQFDEDYPFLHPDGKTLYFSSKGYTSMGGYDVFKSTFNAITKEWSTPQNLDFPINTPDDDILYISDMENKLAYFASSRASKQGEFTVYNVAVKSVPFIHSVINGFFLAESNPEMKNATITVRAIDKDRRYGVHKTKSKTGEYLLMFPTNGGKFKILVETSEGAPVHSAIIEIPELKDFRYLKQELRLVGEGDDEKLIVKNLFDESDDFDMNNPLVVQNILKERAKMEVNITEEELNSSVKFSEEESFAGNNLSNSLGTALTNTLNKSAYKELSDKELIDKTNETVSKIISQIEISRVKSISSYKIAEDKSYEAKLLFAESEQLIIDAELVGSEKEKQEKTVLAESKKMEAAMFVNEVVVALSIAKTLDNEMIERASDLERVKSLQRVINAKIDIKERGLAELELKKLDEIATASYHNESALDIESKIINDNFLTEEKKYNKLNENVVDLNDRENELTASIKKLNEKKEQTKKKKEVEGIDAQIKSLEFDIEDTQYDLEKARKKIPFAKVSYLQSKSEAAITQSVIAMLNGEDNDDIEITDSQKIKIENDLAYFKKNGLVGLLEQEEFTSLDAIDSESLQGAEAVVSEKVEPVAVVDSKELEFEEVAIVSESEEGVAEAMAVEETEFTEEPTTYKGKHTAELDSFSGKDTYESTTLKAAIYADRAKDIEEEITLKKADLSIVNDAEKKGIENDIAILEYSLLEQEEFASLYAIESKSLQGTEVITTEKVEPVDIVNSERLEPEEIAEVTDVDGAELIAEPTTYKGKHTAELAIFSGKDTYESTTLKAEIHADWAKDIEEEITLKKADLLIANAAEKKEIEKDIAILEYSLLEQEEFASLYAFQSASLQGAEAVVSEKVEPVAVVDSKELEFEEVAIVSESEEGVAEAMAVEETEFTEEPTTYKGKHTAELDSFSGKDTYESTTLKAAIYADRAKDIEEEITLKKADLSIVNDAEKKGIENDIAILEYSLLEQEEFASLYAIESKSLQGTEVITTEKVEPVDIVNSERLEPEEIAEVTDVDGAELIAEPTTYKGKHTAELAIFSGKDTYESTTLKAEIHADWAKDIEEEITLKKADLLIANAAEKKEIEKDIAILEYSLLEQEEFASLYAFQSASLQGADLITAEKVEPVVTNVNNGNINKELNSEPGAKESAVDFIEELTLADKEVISELEPTTITTVKKEASYIEYAALKKQKRRLVKEAKVEYIKSKQVENEIGRQKQLIGSLNSIDETTETEVQKTDRVLEIEKIEKAISGNEIKLIALRKRVKEMQDSAQNLNKQADAILANTNEATAKNYAVIEKAETFDSNLIAKVMRKSIDSSEIKEPIVNTTRASIVSIDNIPTVLKESIFVMNKNTAVYNESKRIPVSPKLPEGLVFKVQIGAFRNPIPQSHFRGFAPIMAENAGKGITRYTAGLFKTFNMANEAKGSIRSIGYSDAFVVAFFNGKRINMTQAREMLNGGAANEESIANNKKANNIQNTSASITPKILVVTKEVKDGISKDVRNIEGVFFTIQVGVYSKEVTIGQLNNLSPLNSERTASGLIRYTSGMFTTLEEANAVKERIRADGITDAFLVAYSNGVKTNIAAAKTKLELNAISPSNKVPAENLTIKFKVQLGEYTSDVSVDEADLFLKLTSRGIKNYIQDDKTIYIIGSFNSYSSATDLQIEMKEMGVRNPKVVAFEKSKAIDLNEALKRIENK